MIVTQNERVFHNRHRAKRIGQIATLTVEEWEQTIAHFNGLCAYCLMNPFTELDHYLPIKIAGTHVGNCVPACTNCNRKKGNRTGEALITIFDITTIERIEQYLASYQSFSTTVEPYESSPRKTRMPETTDTSSGLYHQFTEYYYNESEARKKLGVSRNVFNRYVERGVIYQVTILGKSNWYDKQKINMLVCPKDTQNLGESGR